jgi:exonuclease VII large subunit
MDDIRAQLRELEAAVGLQVHSTAVTRPDEVADAVRRAAPQADLLVVTRGGGTAVEDLDADELIQAIADSVVPAVVAVGHAGDVLVLGRVAARAFATPTEFGVWLREALLRKQARVVDAARQRRRGRLLVQQIAVLTDENRALRATAERAAPLQLERNRLATRVRILTALVVALAVILVVILVILVRP